MRCPVNFALIEVFLTEIFNMTTGYKKSGNDPHVCIDNDECSDMTDDCSDEATCTNTESSFTCTCNKGSCSELNDEYHCQWSIDHL